MSEKDSNKYVEKWRENKGLNRYKEVYRVLTVYYGVPSNQAQKMKYWGIKKIISYLKENDIQLLDPFYNLKELWS